VLYVNGNQMAWILTMIETGGATTLGQQVFLQNCAGLPWSRPEGQCRASIPSLVDIQQRLTGRRVLEVVTKDGR